MSTLGLFIAIAGITLVYWALGGKVFKLPDAPAPKKPGNQA